MTTTNHTEMPSSPVAYLRYGRRLSQAIEIDAMSDEACFFRLSGQIPERLPASLILFHADGEEEFAGVVCGDGDGFYRLEFAQKAAAAA
jgi:hypothetical protein